MTYKILTFLIILFGKIRNRLSHDSLRLRRNSPLEMNIPFFYIADKNGILITCCDCGLEHRLLRHRVLSPYPERQKDVLKALPMRPPDYDYSWRLLWVVW